MKSITGNTVTGAGLIPTTAQNGIQIRRGATGSINTNTVTGNAYTGHEVNATGITVTYPGNDVIIQGNIVNHNTANIYTYEAHGVQILNNQVSDAADGRVMAGITADSDFDATATVGITVTITGNSVKNNLSGGSHQGPGIFLWGVNSGTVSGNEIVGSGDDGILIGSSGNIAITCNRFSGNGLLVADPNAAAIDFGGVIPELEIYGFQPNPLGGFSVHNNSFVGNRNGIWNYDIVSVNATCNWWGAANGPGPVGPGSGDKVSTNVTFAPWQIAPGGACIGGNVVTNKDQCKNNGWKTLVRANGTPFKNQGSTRSSNCNVHRRLGADNPTVRVVFEAESPQDVSLARFTASPKDTRDNSNLKPSGVEVVSPATGRLLVQRPTQLFVNKGEII